MRSQTRAISSRVGGSWAGGAPAPAARGRGETVLLVDDEPAVRMLVAEALEEAGYTVIQAANGLAAMAVVELMGCLPCSVTSGCAAGRGRGC